MNNCVSHLSKYFTQVGIPHPETEWLHLSKRCIDHEAQSQQDNSAGEFEWGEEILSRYIKGHSYIFYNKWLLHQGNLEPGSTYIISLAAHNKLGFSKSARITVTLPQSQLSDTGGEREHVIEVLGPGIVHQRGLFSLNCGGKISIK